MPRKRPGFDVVVKAARSLPDIERSTAWGASSLKAGGRLLACQAIHKSAEPDSIVVKIPMDQRAELIAAEPDVYYITEHYVNYPSVLVRLPRINQDALRDLLGMAWQFANRTTKPRARKGVKKEKLASLVLAAAVAAATVSAHHGKEGFDDAPITLRGTIVDAVWQNPHVVITLEVKDADGKAKRWAIDGSPPNAMTRGRFSRDDLKAGAMLTVTGFPTADRTRLTARSISYPDGRIQTTSNEFYKRLVR